MTRTAGGAAPSDGLALSTSLRYLASAVRQNRARSTLIAVLLPVSVVPQLLTPEIFRRIIDSSMSEAPISTAWYLVGTYFVLAVGGQGVALLLAFLTANLAATAAAGLRHRTVTEVLRQDGAFFQEFNPGELVERIDGDTGRIGEAVSGALVDIAAQTLLAVGTIAALYLLDWRFGLLFTAFAMAMAALLRRQTGRALPHVAEQRRAEAEVVGFLDERVGGSEDIRGVGGSEAVRLSLRPLLDREYRAGRREARIGSRWPATIQGLSALGVLFALGLGGWLHDNGQVTVGTVFAALSYATLLRFPLARLTTRVQDVEHTAVSLHRLEEMRRPTGTPDGDQLLAAETFDLRFDRVTFRYGDGPPVLSDLSFELAHGRKLGIVGRTGSGKSTVLGLVFRRFDPVDGTVHLGGHDVRTLVRASLRHRICYIPQAVRILPASLRANVAVFDDTVGDTRIEQAIRAVGLGPWFERLPAGLDTVLTVADARISAGQAQLLSLARAFVADPAVVLLDEPSSTLDPHSENLLQQALHRFLVDRTGIVVTHRTSTLNDVDSVLVLDGGRLVEFGNRAALQADPDSALNRVMTTSGPPS